MDENMMRGRRNWETYDLLKDIWWIDYGLEGAECGASGVVKYQLEKCTPTEALDKLSDPVKLLTESKENISYEELNVGSEEIKQLVLHFLKAMDPESIMENASANFFDFLSDCERALKDGVEKGAKERTPDVTYIVSMPWLM